MNNTLLLLIIILILFLSSIFFYLYLNKTEKFGGQCTSLETTTQPGLCGPYYGVPPAESIHPGDHILNSQERKAYNKEAARVLCDKTPGCKGIFQNQSTHPNDNKHEAYLCKPEFTGQYITDSGFDFETHLCQQVNVADGPQHLHDTDKIMLLYNLNGTYNNYKREFTRHNHYIYNGYRVYTDDDYITDSNGVVIQEYLDDDVGEFEANHLNRLCEFVRSYPDGIGFEILQETPRKKRIRFFKKRYTYSLLIKPGSDYTIYTSIISDVIERPYFGWCYYNNAHRGNIRTNISGNSNSNWPYLTGLARMIRGQDGYFMFFCTGRGNNNVSIYVANYVNGARTMSQAIGHFQDGVGFNHDNDKVCFYFNYVGHVSYMWIPVGPADLDRANNTSYTGFVR